MSGCGPTGLMFWSSEGLPVCASLCSFASVNDSFDVHCREVAEISSLLACLGLKEKKEKALEVAVLEFFVHLYYATYL